MQPTRRISVLSVGQDNLFAELPHCCVDHVSTGKSITPFSAQRKSLLRRIPAILVRVCAGKYDLIVLPAVDLRWAYDQSFLKRGLRFVVAHSLRFRPISACVNRLLSRRATRVIVLDRYDSHDTLLDYLSCVTSARRYFKSNLRESDHIYLNMPGNGGGCQFKYLPYWIVIEKYEMPVQHEKDIDILFAGNVNSEERRVSLEMLRQLELEGYRIKIVAGHLPFREYLALMSRSWLTLSPQGCGYNGFRHYESMVVGSVPLINRSEPPILNDFRHGENCFLYSTTRADLGQVAKEALSDKARLVRMSQRLPQFVVSKHSIQAVGQYLLRETFEGWEGDGITSQPRYCQGSDYGEDAVSDCQETIETQVTRES